MEQRPQFITILCFEALQPRLPAPTNSTNVVRIGARGGTTPSLYFTGILASMRIYNRALTAAERYWNYKADMRMLAARGGTLPDAQWRYPTLLAMAANAANVLTIPTYDSNPNVGHPDVLYVAGGWNGYPYWMAMTPYPSTDRENPSIVASADGNTWVVPAGLTNRVVPLPAGGELQFRSRSGFRPG